MRIPLIFQPRSLQQRNLLFLMLPTLLVLLVMAVGSLLLVRTAMLSQWEQAAIARMQTAAHQVDMRLMRPKRLLMLFQEQTGEHYNRHISEFLIERLKNLEGVVEVKLSWEGESTGGEAASGSLSMGRMGGRNYHRMNPLEVTPPVYDAGFNGSTISLVSEFKDADNQSVGRIEVKISFFDLIDTMVKSSWWQSNRAYLVDSRGGVLTRTARGDTSTKIENFGQASEVERLTLSAMQEKSSGTILGSGMPPAEVSGFYRLQEAPWTMVVIVPGEVALAPMLKFRNYYFATLGLGILLALLLIRVATGGTVRAIREVSTAATALARGDFRQPLPEDRRDEVGELIRNFNIMTSHLQERLQLQQAMGMAREVQQNLLPQSSYQAAGLDVSGVSLYCEETGGDYFDLLPDRRDPSRIAVVIGDVVGHGIGAALLMASIRALVRCRTALPGDPVSVISDVNEILCRDTERSGNFVSLLYLQIDCSLHLARWVRCGHDPAIVYDPATGVFSELRGEGLVLGFDEGWRYSENVLDLTGRPLVILLGSDGLWDVENEAGEMFGKKRVKQLIADHCQGSAEQIIEAMVGAVNRFRGARAASDDITLVVVKTDVDHHDRQAGGRQG